MSLLRRMKAMRHIKAMLAGIGLIIITNAIVLAGVAYNRSGEPESTITLTERELSLPYRYLGKEENSGIHLRITHRNRDYGYFSRDNKPSERLDWFNKEKLAELGFDVSKPFIRDEDKRHYQRLIEKEVFLVLEYNGMAYQSVLAAAQKHVDDLLAEQANAQKISRAENNLAREKTSASRLFVIDAGLDRDALRAKYTDRTKFLLMKGLVKARITNNRSDGSGLSGYIKSLSNKTVHVPLQHHEVLEAAVGEGTRRQQNVPPRFEATINVGQRLESWLVGVEGLGGE
ncbi:MAG: DUF4824 family protein [Porticoccus sp.]|nr:DUF4824 family protein [Porticoccus sp.]